ncbi:MAG TPA: TonB-dependent receptor, partial [Candidatus Sulfotelmatobacter sp.]|nr:TonB-dependent receptor [Candidatus Sulfotelmatobacter sp.]
ASDTHEWSGNLAWGKQWDRGFITLVSSFQDRGDLSGADRTLSANADHRSFGGRDARLPFSCNPGNVFTVDGTPLPGGTSSFAAVSASATGNPQQSGFQGTYGLLNTCSLTSTTSLIPEARQASVFASAKYEMTSNSELFSELLFSNTKQTTQSTMPGLFGLPGLAQFRVPASNPFNPFGRTVGVSVGLAGVGPTVFENDTDYYRALVGVRGKLFQLDRWDWELAGWGSKDENLRTTSNNLNAAAAQAALNATDPALALNPFVSGPIASQQVLRSLLRENEEKYRGQMRSLNGFVRGPLVELSSGSVEVVAGGEIDRNDLFSSRNTTSHANFHRLNYALFAELLIPILGSQETVARKLAATVAARYDHDDEFGGAASPQFGLEWRPADGLLIRGTYADAFKAPSLFDVYRSTSSFQTIVLDPRRGNQPTTIVETVGGNRNLRPESGWSRTFGVVYAPTRSDGLEVSLTHWDVNEIDSIQFLSSATLVPNESFFPGAVVRAPSQNGQVGAIIQVNDSSYNFGRIEVAGIDYAIKYRYRGAVGDWVPSLSATQTYHYRAALTPGLAATDRVSAASDDGNWAPRWRGIAQLDWQYGALRASVAGRYTGAYQDYGSTRDIGDFWLYDFNTRYTVAFSEQALVREAYAELGGANILDKEPQFSNYNFGFAGYDPAQADIRGRFLYLRLGTRF